MEPSKPVLFWAQVLLWYGKRKGLDTKLQSSLATWTQGRRLTHSDEANEKNTGCFGYVGDEILPSYICGD